MAYREFHFEKTYAKPDTSGFLDQAAASASHAIANIFGSIAQKKQQREVKANEYKYTLEKGSSENDNIYFEEGAKAATGLMKEGIRSNDTNKQQQAKHLMETLNGQHQERRVQDEQFKVANNAIDDREKKDPYYDGNVDREGMRIAYFGKDHDRNFLTRKDDLQTASKVAGNNPRAFKANEYTADYVNKILGEKKAEIGSDSPTQQKTTSLSSPFYDAKTGELGASTDDALTFLKSRPDGSVQQFFQTKVNDQLDQEIEQMKKRPDFPAEWKDKSDLEIKNELINDSSQNKINKEDYNTRIQGLAQKQLNDAAHISSKVNVEQKVDNTATGGLYQNDAISHGYSFQNENVGVDNPSYTEGTDTGGASTFKGNQISGPGGNLMIGKGATLGNPLSLELSAKKVFNMGTGQTSTGVGGTSKYNVLSYQIQGYDKNGNPETISAKTPEEMVKFYQNAPAIYFKDLDPNMHIAFKAYSLDKDTILGDVRRTTTDLNTKLAKATQDGDAAKAETIQGQIIEMNKVKRMFDPDAKFSDEDILNTMAKNGITAVRNNVLVKAEPNDLQMVNTFTRGLDLSKKEKRSPAMLMVEKARTEAYNRAAAAGFAKKPTGNKTTKAGADNHPPVNQGGFTYTWNEKTGAYE